VLELYASSETKQKEGRSLKTTRKRLTKAGMSPQTSEWEHQADKINPNPNTDLRQREDRFCSVGALRPARKQSKRRASLRPQESGLTKGGNESTKPSEWETQADK